jgi:fatty acid desaturase
MYVYRWFTLYYFGTGWLPYCAAVALLVIAQAQSGWLQHDFGHLSVFKSRSMNLLAHRLVKMFHVYTHIHARTRTRARAHIHEHTKFRLQVAKHESAGA